MANYPTVNAQTIANVIAASANSQEQKWVLKVMVDSRGKHPLKSLMGGYKGGRPFMEIMDTSTLKGQTVHLTTRAPLGGPGVQGDNQRVGNEEKIRHNVYSFSVGGKWNGVSWTKFAASQSVIGSTLDKEASSALSEWLAWQQGWDIEAEMIVKSTAFNTVRPNGKISRASLGTDDYLSGETVVRAGNQLGWNSGKKLLQAKSKAGAEIKRFLLVAPNFALKEWKASPTYAQQVTTGYTRGDENPLWAGGIPDYQGHLIWEWELDLSTQYGPIGAMCVPIAKLGVAITANDAAQDVTGGGSAEGAALTDRLYYQAFSSSAYQGFEDTAKRAAITDTDRYGMIKDATTGKFGFFTFRVNNGNKLVMTERLRASAAGISVTTLTGSSITWDSANWPEAILTDSFAVGSQVYEVNAKGVPICYSYMLGDEALITGYGSFDGEKAVGNRTSEIQDHGRSLAIGIEAVWGCKAIPRTDGLVGGYVLIESAFSVEGMPSIS